MKMFCKTCKKEIGDIDENSPLMENGSFFCSRKCVRLYDIGNQVNSMPKMRKR